MGVAILHPQDCLKDPSFSRKTLISPSSPNQPRNLNPNPNPTRSNRVQPSRRKRSLSRLQNTSPASPAMVAQSPAKSLVMGQVKILKRGEELAKTTLSRGFPDLGSTNRLGPDPKLVPKQARLTESNPAAGFYAGMAFITSPPPSSVPLPAFFTRKTVSVNKHADAASDLRRILRLDLP